MCTTILCTRVADGALKEYNRQNKTKQKNELATARWRLPNSFFTCRQARHTTRLLCVCMKCVALTPTSLVRYICIQEPAWHSNTFFFSTKKPIKKERGTFIFPFSFLFHIFLGPSFLDKLECVVRSTERQTRVLMASSRTQTANYIASLLLVLGAGAAGWCVHVYMMANYRLYIQEPHEFMARHSELRAECLPFHA